MAHNSFDPEESIMPGIYGFLNKGDNKGGLNSMANAMDGANIDPAFIDNHISASRRHNGKIGNKNPSLTTNDLCLWLEGEAYNVQEVAKSYALTADDLSALVLEAYRKNILNEVLSKIDGYYCCALYDRASKKISLITDRYGMRVLYCYTQGQKFAWASEVKALLALDFVDWTIDPDCLDTFIDIGYLLEDRTWFKHIKLVDPATIMEIDVQSGRASSHRYWNWSAIKPSADSYEQAVETVSGLLINAVKRRFNPSEKTGVALSGGLDSRMIFAAVNTLYPDYQGYAYTFGKKDCDDIKIAREVASRSNWKHEIYEFTSSNWFEPRIETVRKTDGMMNIKHMHGSEFMEAISRHIDININGYAGDVVLGGGFLNDINIDRRINADIASRFYGKHTRHARLDDPFYDIDHAEPHLYMNRVRRFTNMGSIASLPHVEQRKPFFDNDLLEYVFSIPDSYRLGNRLYKDVLLKNFPKYFADIPWQKTGCVIGAPQPSGLIPKYWGKLSRLPSRLGLIESRRDYTNYPHWIRGRDLRTNLQNLLSRDGSSYAALTNRDFEKEFLIPHMNNRLTNNSETILRAATVELYLRHITKGKNGGAGGRRKPDFKLLI